MQYYGLRSNYTLKERNLHPRLALVWTNRVTKKLTMTDLARTFDALRPLLINSRGEVNACTSVGGTLVPEQSPRRSNIFI